MSYLFHLLVFALVFTAHVCCAVVDTKDIILLKEKLSDFKNKTKASTDGPRRNHVRIFGGLEPKIGQFKQTVYLMMASGYQLRGSEHLNYTFKGCTGAIISQRWVLTAAHCVPGPFLYLHYFKAGQSKNEQDGPYTSAFMVMEVTAGIVEAETETTPPTAVKMSFDDPPPVKHVELIVHHDAVTYINNDPEKPKWKYDVALVKTRSKFPFGAAIGPVPLMSGRMPEMFPGKCIALGFGQGTVGDTGGDPTSNNKLIYVHVTAGGTAFCKNITGIEDWTDEQYVCALNMDDYTRMACTGDSGGPLLCGPKRNRIAVGVLHGSKKTADCGEGSLDNDYTFTGMIEKWVKAKTNGEVNFKILRSKSKGRESESGGRKSESGGRRTWDSTTSMVVVVVALSGDLLLLW